MAIKSRSSSILINEAKLLASAPDTVAAWLAKSGEVSSWGEDADAELELNLLARNERLIDLALAEHGLAQEVLHQLFHREEEVIRVAVLSNQRLLKSKTQFGLWVEYWQFANEGPDVSWMAGLSLVEAQALFANRSLPDEFIIDFFDQKRPWMALDNDQRLRAAKYVFETLKERQVERDKFYNSRIFRSSAACDAVWRFSGTAPVDVLWAQALGELYSCLTPCTISNFDALKVAERWYPQDTDKGELERESEYSGAGYLSTYQSVRYGVARIASQKLSSGSLILKNEDVAIRCGGYSTLSLSAGEIKAAFELDGKLACNHLIKNDKIWKNKELLSALENICSKSSHDIGSPWWNFGREEERRLQLPPNRLRDEKPTNYSKPVTESSVREVTEGIVRSREFVALTNLIKIQAKEKAWAFWVIIAILAVIFFKI